MRRCHFRGISGWGCCCRSQQALFASPGASRRIRPAETARILHRLVSELATLATAASVTKRATKRRPLTGAPQTSPLSDDGDLNDA